MEPSDLLPNKNIKDDSSQRELSLRFRQAQGQELIDILKEAYIAGQMSRENLERSRHVVPSSNGRAIEALQDRKDASTSTPSEKAQRPLPFSLDGKANLVPRYPESLTFPEGMMTPLPECEDLAPWHLFYACEFNDHPS